MNRKLLHFQYEEIKRACADLIEDYAVTYPVDVTELAKALGAKIVPLPKHGQELPSHDGFTKIERNELSPEFRIYINLSHSETRKRFTIAHEIGHIWLGHFETNCQLTTQEQEGAANFFASYLLAPDVLISHLKTKDIPSIANNFNISENAAKLAFRRFYRALNQGKGFAQSYDVQILQSSNFSPTYQRGIA